MSTPVHAQFAALLLVSTRGRGIEALKLAITDRHNANDVELVRRFAARRFPRLMRWPVRCL